VVSDVPRGWFVSSRIAEDVYKQDVQTRMTKEEILSRQSIKDNTNMRRGGEAP
jgi:hypothetical protein